MYKTKISRLTHFITLTKLILLSVFECQISDPNELLALSKMDALNEFLCFGNKMCEDQLFKQKLAFALPATIEYLYGTE